MERIVAVCVNSDGSIVEGGLGKATHLAVATVVDDVVTDWQLHDVGWDVLHDVGEHGAHHARIVRFMREHNVSHVVAPHIGPPMQNTLSKLGVSFTLEARGDARAAALT